MENQEPQPFTSREELVAVQERIEAACFEAQRRWAEIDPTIKNYSLLGISLEDEAINFEWHEYWNYGGYEHHVDGIPLSLIYDPEGTLQRERDRRAAARQREEAAKIASKEMQDRLHRESIERQARELGLLPS